MKLNERALDKAAVALSVAIRDLPPMGHGTCANTGQPVYIFALSHAAACVNAYLRAVEGSPAAKVDEQRVNVPQRDSGA